MAGEFVADDKVKEVAEAYAIDAVMYALRNVNVMLNFTEPTIERVEEILDRLHSDTQTQNPTTEQVETIARAFGSYIGQVFIGNHGGSWGWVTLGGERVVGLRAAKDETVFRPCARPQSPHQRSGGERLALLFAPNRQIVVPRLISGFDPKPPAQWGDYRANPQLR